MSSDQVYMDAVQKTRTLASLLSSKQGIDKAKRVMMSMNGDNLLHFASSIGAVRCIRELLAAGFDINGWCGVRQSHDRFPKLANLNAASVDTCTFRSCLGPSISQYSMTPLHFAAAHGHPDAVGILCRMGADVDCTHIEASDAWDQNPTPLISACQRGDASCAVVLLAHGSDPTIEARTCLPGNYSRSIQAVDRPPAGAPQGEPYVEALHGGVFGSGPARLAKARLRATRSAPCSCSSCSSQQSTPTERSVQDGSVSIDPAMPRAGGEYEGGPAGSGSSTDGRSQSSSSTDNFNGMFGDDSDDSDDSSEKYPSKAVLRILGPWFALAHGWAKGGCQSAIDELLLFCAGPDGDREVPWSVSCWGSGARRKQAMARWRHGAEAKRDAGMVFQAASEGRPLELAKRLRLGKLAGGMNARGTVKLDDGTCKTLSAVEAARLGGHDECVELLSG